MLIWEADWALRALSILAGDMPGRETRPIRAVAERAPIPRKQPEAILLDLRRQGFVTSRLGKLGSSALARPAEASSVGDVIAALDGPLAPFPCASLTACRPGADCQDPPSCEIPRLTPHDATAQLLDGTRLAALMASRIPLRLRKTGKRVSCGWGGRRQPLFRSCGRGCDGPRCSGSRADSTAAPAVGRCRRDRWRGPPVPPRPGPSAAQKY